MDEKAKEQVKQKVLQQAYDLGYEYERTYRGCGQVVLGALQDAFDMRNDDVFKALSGYAGGGATVGDAGCGAYVGGICFLSGLRGRERSNFADPEGLRFVSFAPARKLHRKFAEEYGSVICRELQTKLMERPYYLPDPDEMKKFDDAGGHSAVCPEVCGKAARWAAEIAFEEGLISDEKLAELAKQ